jgi:hypothetical protein
MAQTDFYGISPEARPKPSCKHCTEERPCTWVCLDTDSLLAGVVRLADELLVEFEREVAEAPDVAFVTQGLSDSFQ